MRKVCVSLFMCLCVYVFVCVRDRERKTERERKKERDSNLLRKTLFVEKTFVLDWGDSLQHCINKISCFAKIRVDDKCKKCLSVYLSSSRYKMVLLLAFKKTFIQNLMISSQVFLKEKYSLKTHAISYSLLFLFNFGHVTLFLS